MREQAAGLQPDTRRIVAQVPLAGEHVPAAGGIGDEFGADGFAFFGREGYTLRIGLDILDAGIVFDRGAVVNGSVGQILIRILAEQVRFVAFPVRRDHQLGGLFRLLVLSGAVIDEAEIFLHAEMVGHMRMEEFAGIEFGLELRDSKALRHDFDHAEGVAHGGFAEGEAGMRAGVYDHHFGAFVGQDGSEHAAFEPCA